MTAGPGGQAVNVAVRPPHKLTTAACGAPKPMGDQGRAAGRLAVEDEAST
jgi:hypothetical protein